MIELKEKFGYLFEDDLLNEISSTSIVRNIAKGETIMDYGTKIRSIPLLLSGVIKIYREDENGDEILLYFIETGETCAMSMTCCLNNTLSTIRAVAESDSKIIMLPVVNMETWMAKYPSWRKFVMDSYHNRFNELLESVDSLAFMQMDDRLLNYLKNKSEVNQNKRLDITHQDIALELNTSRVVVSRLLKKLENNGQIVLGRNQIEIISL